MSIFGGVSAEKLSTFKFEFNPNFETNSIVSLTEDGNLVEELQSWVWDLYYAKTLYTLDNNTISEGLKSHLEKWAEPLVVGLAFPLQVAEEMGLLVLDKELQLIDKALSVANQEAYVLEVFQEQDERLYIQTHLPAEGYQNRLAYSVIALGQYFINKRKEFARVMSLHVLSMRKYYKKIRPFTDLKSTIEAPSFAIKESMELFDELNRESDITEKELEDN